MDVVRILNILVMMKCRLNITIEKHYVEALQRVSGREKRSVDDQIESILAEWFRSQPLSEQVVNTASSFDGKFSRDETYGER